MFEIISTCKGGGYHYCRTNPPHPKRNAKGLYPLHRVLVENRLGRLLEKWEHVHHDDENKANDNPENLIVKTASEHSRHHRPALEPITWVCPCGTTFTIKRHLHKLRLKRNKTAAVYCSRSCGAFFGRPWDRSHPRHQQGEDRMATKEADWQENASAAAGVATATRTAEPGNRHSIVSVVASFSSAQIALLEIKLGTTVEMEVYVHNAIVLDLSGAIRGGSGQAVSAVLAAGTGTGKVTISGYTS